VQSTVGSETLRVVRVSTTQADDVIEEVASHRLCDAGDVLVHQVSGKVLAASFTYFEREWTVLNAEVRLDDVN
jgi:hypothetical protein